jgi:prophage tail gpP-like protein
VSLFTFAMRGGGGTRRVTLAVSGVNYDLWTRVEIIRDLSELCGSFTVELDDVARTMAALGTVANNPVAIKRGQACTLSIDGEPVLIGWVEDVLPQISDRAVSVVISGRDRTGDLVDCAAAPDGPVEYHKIKLETLATKLCAPFRVSVRTEVDTGEPFDKVSIETAETVLSVLEKYCRKRAVLMVSDGVGGLLLTRAGTDRAAGEIVFGQTINASRGTFSDRARFSHYYVKGQSAEAGGQRGSTAPLDGTAQPLTTPPAAGGGDAASGKEQRAVAIRGLAIDKEIKRWRPTVRLTRSQGSLDDAQSQAEWACSTAWGASERIEYSIPDLRCAGELWRPNTLVRVVDNFQGVDDDLLVAGVINAYGDMGSMSFVRVTRKEAYDIFPEDEEEIDAQPTNLDGTAEALR